MRYRSGEVILVGDYVAIEHGATSGVVHDIIEDLASIAEWGVNKPGVMVAAEPFGLVFWSVPSSDDHDPLIFVSRKCA